MIRSIFWLAVKKLNEIIPKSNKKILLYFGVEYKDNIKALGDHLFSNGYNQHYRIYLGGYQRKYNNILISGKKHHIYNKLVSIFIFLRAKYVFYAFNSLPIKPSKTQKVFQMWHGMPLKSIFNHNSNKKTDYDYFTYILATSPLFAKIVSDCVPCDSDKVVIMGQPKIDQLVKKTNRSKDKIIFWAPTFRKAKYWNQTDSTMESLIPLVPDNEINHLNQFLQSNDIQLIVKLHPMEDCKDDLEIIMDNIQVYSHQKFTEHNYELYEYLADSSALITDYSSTYIDYLLLDHPIAFVVNNINEYSHNRGFIFDDPLNYMPGNLLYSLEDLYGFIQDIAIENDKYSEERKKINSLFNDYDMSVSNCEHILRFMGITNDRRDTDK